MEYHEFLKVHSYVFQGTVPISKKNNLTVVKKYINEVAISKDELLVVEHSEPFLQEKE